MNIFKTVQEEINCRIEYEKQIKQLAFPNYSHTMSSSDIVLQNS